MSGLPPLSVGTLQLPSLPHWNSSCYTLSRGCLYAQRCIRPVVLSLVCHIVLSNVLLKHLPTHKVLGLM